MQIRSLEDMTKAELIALITQEREQAEAVGAGGVSLMGDARDTEIERLRKALETEFIWHQAQDKAISKQPNANTGDKGWRRGEHQEQMALIQAALAQQEQA